MIDEDVTASTPDEVITRDDKSVKHEYTSAGPENYPSQPRKSNPKKTIALIAAGCVLLLACCCCSILFMSNQGFISEDTVANLCEILKTENATDPFGICESRIDYQPEDIEG